MELGHLRDSTNATGDGSTANRTDLRNPGQIPTPHTDFDANDFFARFDTPMDGDSANASHWFTSNGGGYQPFMERNASLQRYYRVKAGGLFTTDNLAPRPDNAIPRTGREVFLGREPTSEAMISKEFNDLKMNDTNTMDDFRGMGKISAFKLFAIPGAQ